MWIYMYKYIVLYLSICFFLSLSAPPYVERDSLPSDQALVLRCSDLTATKAMTFSPPPRSAHPRARSSQLWERWILAMPPYVWDHPLSIGTSTGWGSLEIFVWTWGQILALNICNVPSSLESGNLANPVRTRNVCARWEACTKICSVRLQSWVPLFEGKVVRPRASCPLPSEE